MARVPNCGLTLYPADEPLLRSGPDYLFAMDKSQLRPISRNILNLNSFAVPFHAVRLNNKNLTAGRLFLANSFDVLGIGMRVFAGSKYDVVRLNAHKTTFKPSGFRPPCSD